MSEQSSAKVIGKIPVRNLWLLMLYASDLYKKLRDVPEKRLAAEQNPDKIPDLLAEILTVEVEWRLRRMLTHELRRRQADLTRVRGRINHIRTKRRHLLQRGKIACSFDEFTVDVPRNRFVMAALDRLSAIVHDESLKRRCRIDATIFARCGVSNSFGARQHTTNIRNARYGQDDARMVAAAQLAWDLRIPTEESGHLDVVLLDRTKENLIRDLFERAVGGFYSIVLDKWQVHRGKRFGWHAKERTPGINEILPEMKTDIVVEKADRSHRIVIDTKFTEITTRWHRERLKSSNIYQIYSYLRSQEREGDNLSMTSTGMLLYPSVGTDYDESATIQGHKLRFATVDLASDTASIRDRLRFLIPD